MYWEIVVGETVRGQKTNIIWPRVATMISRMQPFLNFQLIILVHDN